MGRHRAVSPVVGVALMVVITLLLASTIMIGLPDSGIDMPAFADDSEEDTDVQTQLIVAVRGEPGVDDEHQFRIHIEEGSDTAGNSLNQLTITYPDAVDASAVSGSDIDQVGIDRDGDGQLEADAMVDLSGLSTSDDGSTLTVTFGGNHDLEAGYWIVLDVSDLDNPDTAGEYSVSIDVNGDVTKQGTLEID